MLEKLHTYFSVFATVHVLSIVVDPQGHVLWLSKFMFYDGILNEVVSCKECCLVQSSIYSIYQSSSVSIRRPILLREALGQWPILLCEPWNWFSQPSFSSYFLQLYLNIVPVSSKNVFYCQYYAGATPILSWKSANFIWGDKISLYLIRNPYL